jgi:hypothetical protein
LNEVENEMFEIERLTVKFRKVHHGAAPTIGIRISDNEKYIAI